MATCEICADEFVPKNKYKPSRTCSKECKNRLASSITAKQFSNPAAVEHHRQKILAQKKNPEYWKKFNESISTRDKRWQEQGHPRKGMCHTQEAKTKIGQANTGRFKGKTWEEIYGTKLAKRRRSENSVAMCRINEELLVNKKSNYENLIYEYIAPLGFVQNKQIGKFNVDFLNEKTKTIIEFNGDYWHMNPDMYEADFVNAVTKIQARDKWNMDSERIKELEKLGYNVIVWWENNLIKNRIVAEDSIKSAIEDYRKKYGTTITQND